MSWRDKGPRYIGMQEQMRTYSRLFSRASIRSSTTITATVCSILFIFSGCLSILLVAGLFLGPFTTTDLISTIASVLAAAGSYYAARASKRFAVTRSENAEGEFYIVVSWILLLFAVLTSLMFAHQIRSMSATFSSILLHKSIPYTTDDTSIYLMIPALLGFLAGAAKLRAMGKKLIAANKQTGTFNATGAALKERRMNKDMILLFTSALFVATVLMGLLFIFMWWWIPVSS